MGGNGGLFGAILNPIGAIAKSVGGVGGMLIDPVGSLARTQPKGSALGMVIDPIGAIAGQFDTAKPTPTATKPQEILSYEERMGAARDRLKRKPTASNGPAQSQTTSVFKDDATFFGGI